MKKKRLFLLIISIFCIAGVKAFSVDNEFVEDKQGLIPTISDINNKLFGYYEDSGDVIYLLITEQEPTDEAIETYQWQLETDSKGRCGVLIVYIPEKRIRLESNERCESKIKTIDKAAIKEKAQELKGEKDFNNQLLNFLITKVHQLLVPEDSIIKSLRVEFEKNSQGNEFRGLTGNYGNRLVIQVFYPTKYMSSKTEYETTEKDGSITLQDTQCELHYQLDPSTTAVSGTLELDQSSLYDKSSFILYYYPPYTDYTYHQNNNIKVDISCKRGYKDFKTKEIVNYMPMVFVVPGLWHSPLEDSVDTINGIKNKGLNVIPFWFEDHVGDIRVIANELKDSVEEKLKERDEDLIKTSKVDIIGHSMGGLISRYYVNNLEGYKKVGDGNYTGYTTPRGSSSEFCL